MFIPRPQPSDYIDALVCDLAPHARGGRLLMLLNGYFDDSGSHPESPIFVLGGLVSTVDSWKLFSAEWDAKLRQEPSIEYLKMSEANAFTGQFKRGWNPRLRDQKLLELAEIIPKHAMFRADVSISPEIWRSYLKGTMFRGREQSLFLFVLRFVRNNLSA